MDTERIKTNVDEILKTLPPEVTLVAAAKTRSPQEARAAVDAGVKVLGHNYVQEAERMHEELSEWTEAKGVKWHLIGHLQRNKAQKAVSMFHMVETLDSPRLARKLQKECEKAERTLEVLIEVNSGEESNKTGVKPDDVEKLIEEISTMDRLQIKGLMTMGPITGDPENARPYFRLTKQLFDDLAQKDLENVSMDVLSMGMSNSYLQAIEEGATLVRIGTRLFGPR